MLLPVGFLTNCSYYKFKIIVLFCQLYNQHILDLSVRLKLLLHFVVQLNCIRLPLSFYSVVYRIIQSTFYFLTISANSHDDNSAFSFRSQFYCYSSISKSNNQTHKLNSNNVKQISDFIYDLLQRLRITV